MHQQPVFWIIPLDVLIIIVGKYKAPSVILSRTTIVIVLMTDRQLLLYRKLLNSDNSILHNTVHYKMLALAVKPGISDILYIS